MAPFDRSYSYTLLLHINVPSSPADNRRRLWQTINKLLHRNSSSPLPTCTSASAPADSFASFFTDKVSKLRLSLSLASSCTSSPHSPSSPKSPPDFIKPASESEISKMLCELNDDDDENLIQLSQQTM